MPAVRPLSGTVLNAEWPAQPWRNHDLALGCESVGMDFAGLPADLVEARTGAEVGGRIHEAEGAVGGQHLETGNG